MGWQEDTNRLIEIATTCAVEELISPDDRAPLDNEIRNLCGNLYEAFDDSRRNPTPGRSIPSEDYFDEQLGNLRTFALMAIGAERRESYQASQIVEHVNHFAYKVKSLIA